MVEKGKGKNLRGEKETPTHPESAKELIPAHFLFPPFLISFLTKITSSKNGRINQNREEIQKCEETTREETKPPGGGGNVWKMQRHMNMQWSSIGVRGWAGNWHYKVTNLHMHMH